MTLLSFRYSASSIPRQAHRGILAVIQQAYLIYIALYQDGQSCKFASRTIIPADAEPGNNRSITRPHLSESLTNSPLNNIVTPSTLLIVSQGGDATGTAYPRTKGPKHAADKQVPTLGGLCHAIPVNLNNQDSSHSLDQPRWTS